MILRYWKLIGFGILCLLLAVQTWRLDRAQDKYEDCQAGRQRDRAAYAQAQRDAKAKNEQQVQRIVSEQDRITKDVEADLTARLERLRSELRSKAAPRNPGSPEAGPDGKAPGTASDPPAMCLSPEELLRAAEDEERHDQLITWVEEQLKVVR